MSLISNDYINFLKSHFLLDWEGVHGAPHWARVRANGLLLAEQTGADPAVVEVFAFIHDAERRVEHGDPDHGPRAARLAAEINHQFWKLSEAQLQTLVRACAGHSQSRPETDITIQVCWDADRLDLGRVGVRPDPARLYTAAAKQSTMIEWAYQRSLPR